MGHSNFPKGKLKQKWPEFSPFEVSCWGRTRNGTTATPSLSLGSPPCHFHFPLDLDEYISYSEIYHIKRSFIWLFAVALYLLFWVEMWWEITHLANSNRALNTLGGQKIRPRTLCLLGYCLVDVVSTWPDMSDNLECRKICANIGIQWTQQAPLENMALCRPKDWNKIKLVWIQSSPIESFWRAGHREFVCKYQCFNMFPQYDNFQYVSSVS